MELRLASRFVSHLHIFLFQPHPQFFLLTHQAARALGDMKQKEAAATKGRSRAASSFGVAGSIAAKLEQQSMILRLERELEEARRSYLKMNKAEAASNRVNQ